MICLLSSYVVFLTGLLAAEIRTFLEPSADFNAGFLLLFSLAGIAFLTGTLAWRGAVVALLGAVGFS